MHHGLRLEQIARLNEVNSYPAGRVAAACSARISLLAPRLTLP